jgi:hypothetical protein
MNDWTGNAKSIFTCNGASNHSDGERQEHDYYATEPKAVEILLEQEQFSPYVWECACGEGHISEVLKSHGYKVKSSDLYDRGYDGTEIIDFLTVKNNIFACKILLEGLTAYEVDGKMTNSYDLDGLNRAQAKVKINEIWN